MKKKIFLMLQKFTKRVGEVKTSNTEVYNVHEWDDSTS